MRSGRGERCEGGEPWRELGLGFGIWGFFSEGRATEESSRRVEWQRRALSRRVSCGF